jgi:DNA-binding CsgD family transcriptional regulator
MGALAARDAERLLRFISDAEELGGEDPFSPPVLEEFGKLIPAESIGYYESDKVAGRVLVEHEHPHFDDVYGGIEYDERVLTTESPLCPHLKAGHFGGMKVSDLVTRRELLRSRYYRLALEPLGIRDVLRVAIPSPRSHSKLLVLERRDRDFSERDRLLLHAFQPHLGRIRRAAHTRRRLRAAVAGLRWASEHDTHGVVLLTGAGRIELASPPAYRLLRESFGARQTAELPAVIFRWLESDAPTLELHLGERCVTIQRAEGALLLEESHASPDLTPREREILDRLALGETNKEIAVMLQANPATVRKHLEHIYAKLDVHTRTAAVNRYSSMLPTPHDAPELKLQ